MYLLLGRRLCISCRSIGGFDPLQWASNFKQLFIAINSWLMARYARPSAHLCYLSYSCWGDAYSWHLRTLVSILRNLKIQLAPRYGLFMVRAEVVTPSLYHSCYSPVSGHVLPARHYLPPIQLIQPKKISVDQKSCRRWHMRSLHFLFFW